MLTLASLSLAALPVLALLALGSACFGWRSRRGDPHPLRQGILDGATLTGLHVALSTELLGAFGWLSRGPIAAGWAVLIGVALLARRRWPAPSPTRRRGAPVVLLAGAAGIAAITLLIALAAPPNTWDSLTYHMPRVVRWLQDGRVDFFPTWCPRQLYMAPWAEYGIAQLYALWGGDRLANLVQWGCQAGSIVGVSVVAARLGVGATGQAISATFAATLPMGILQASSTQTDAAVAFWLVLLVCHGLGTAESGSYADALLSGAALGLAVLTKQTAYFYAPPLLLWILARALRRRGFVLVPRIGVAAALAILVNAPLLVRSATLWGSPFGPGAWPAHHRPAAVATAPVAARVPFVRWYPTRVLRNLCLHLVTPFRPLNASLARVIRRTDVYAKGSQDLAPPWADELPLSRHEDLAGSTLHLLLLLGVLAGSRLPRHVWPLPIALVTGALVFAFAMPWGLHNTRLHLPLFVLAAPLAGLLLERLRPSWAGTAVAGALLLAALPWLLAGHPRALFSRSGTSVLTLPRIDQYVLNDRSGQLRKPLEDARLAVTLGCRSVGLVLHDRDDAWEYLFWVGTEALRRGVRIEHVGVTNPSNVIAPRPPHPAPDCICDLRAGGGCSRLASGTFVGGRDLEEPGPGAGRLRDPGEPVSPRP